MWKGLVVSIFAAFVLVGSTLVGDGGILKSRDVLTTGAVISFTPASLCPGDFDADGMVNLSDFLAFADVYGASSSDANYTTKPILKPNTTVCSVTAKLWRKHCEAGSTCGERSTSIRETI